MYNADIKPMIKSLEVKLQLLTIKDTHFAFTLIANNFLLKLKIARVSQPFKRGSQPYSYVVATD